jgi:hypothetical protein
MSSAAYPGLWLSAALLLGCAAGCKGVFGSQGPPDDPLLFHTKPLVAKAEGSRPTTFAYAEPPPPAKPHFTPERPTSSGAETSRAMPGVPANRTEADLPAKD